MHPAAAKEFARFKDYAAPMVKDLMWNVYEPIASYRSFKDVLCKKMGTFSCPYCYPFRPIFVHLRSSSFYLRSTSFNFRSIFVHLRSIFVHLRSSSFIFAHLRPPAWDLGKLCGWLGTFRVSGLGVVGIWVGLAAFRAPAGARTLLGI